MFAKSPVRVARQRTSNGYRRSRQTITGMSARRAAISMAVIDQKSLTRECITRSLQALDDRLNIVSFATCEDCLRSMGSLDLILYHAHEAVTDLSCNNQQVVSFKRLLQVVPVII